MRSVRSIGKQLAKQLNAPRSSQRFLLFALRPPTECESRYGFRTTMEQRRFPVHT